MRVRIDRTRMAMAGRFYAYDAYVHVEELEPARVSHLTHFTLKDGARLVDAPNATRPMAQFDMPSGIARYDEFKTHEKAIMARVFGLAQDAYPELETTDRLPLLWIECPSIDEGHATRYVELADCLHDNVFEYMEKCDDCGADVSAELAKRDTNV